MNFLKVFTAAETETTFVTFWTNTNMQMRGALRVFVPTGWMDREVIAELHALQYLLEVVEAVGTNAAGNPTTHLIVSSDVIKQLSQKTAAETHLVGYARFLTTRFKDSPIEVSEDVQWIADSCEINTTLDASTPMKERMYVHGVGEVTVTAHVIERYFEHFKLPPYQNAVRLIQRMIQEGREDSVKAMGVPSKPLLSDAWRELRKHAADKKLVEFESGNTEKQMKYALERLEEGRYFLLPSKNLVIVVQRTNATMPALLTVYPKVPQTS